MHTFSDANDHFLNVDWNRFESRFMTFLGGKITTSLTGNGWLESLLVVTSKMNDKLLLVLRVWLLNLAERFDQHVKKKLQTNLINNSF